MKARLAVLAALVLLVVALASCGPTATSGPAATSVPVVQTVVVPGATGVPVVQTVVVVPTSPPAATTAPQPTLVPPATPVPTIPAVPTSVPTGVPPTAAPAATGTAAAATPAATQPTAAVAQNLVELEWPPQMRLGESGLVRLSLAPAPGGYIVGAEFPGQLTVTSTVPVETRPGFDLAAVARLEGIGFDLAPAGDQLQSLASDWPVTWRWTLTPHAAGRQSLTVQLRLRWTPQAGNTSPERESTVFNKGLQIEVASFLGFSAREALVAGLAALALGGGLSLPLALYVARAPRRRNLAQAESPNAGLVIERPGGIELKPDETDLLRTLFRRYARVTLEAEFRSGYSGARTLLALPVHAGGRTDAYTIAKLGDRASIELECANYEAFVKDTLPPITARIQEAPVTVRGGGLAALRYTFIGEAGRMPLSLREALLADPDPALLEKLFTTFGPNWWLQRRPYTFRLGYEYDRVLPAHYVLEPDTGSRERGAGNGQQATPATTRGQAGSPRNYAGAGGQRAIALDGRTAPGQVSLAVGDVVRLEHFRLAERRPDGKWLSLVGEPPAGEPPLRLRWLGAAWPYAGPARVVATRETLLRGFLAEAGVPDAPLPPATTLLAERVMGTQSVIHGDLNLENILIGPGGFVWLIDFARTREGHPLFDFAHLEAEIIAHVLAPRVHSADELRAVLHAGDDPLLATLHTLAGRCLFDPTQSREYHLALALACAGALKFGNLAPFAKRCLYEAAVHFAGSAVRSPESGSPGV